MLVRICCKKKLKLKKKIIILTLVTNFQFDLKKDVDYISTGLGGGAPAGVPDAVGGGRQGVAWAPAESLITVGLMPQYSRSKQADFNLKQFVKGEHTLAGKDGFI